MPRRFLAWIKFVLTDEENQWDLGILVWLVYNGVFIYQGMVSGLFDFQAFGFGGAALLAGGAGLTWIRQKGKDGTNSGISGS